MPYTLKEANKALDQGLAQYTEKVRNPKKREKVDKTKSNTLKEHQYPDKKASADEIALAFYGNVGEGNDPAFQVVAQTRLADLQEKLEKKPEEQVASEKLEKEARAEIDKEYTEYKKDHSISFGDFFTAEGWKKISTRKENFLTEAVAPLQQIEQIVEENEEKLSENAEQSEDIKENKAEKKPLVTELQKEDLAAIKIKNQLSAYKEERGVSFLDKLQLTAESRKYIAGIENDFYAEIANGAESQSPAIRQLFEDNQQLPLQKVAVTKSVNAEIKDKLADLNQKLKDEKKQYPWLKHPFKRLGKTFTARNDVMERHLQNANSPTDIVALQAFNGGSLKNPSAGEKWTKGLLGVGVGIGSIIALAAGSVITVPLLIGAAVGANKIYNAIGSHQCVKKGAERLIAKQLAGLQPVQIVQQKQEDSNEKSVSKTKDFAKKAEKTSQKQVEMQSQIQNEPTILKPAQNTKQFSTAVSTSDMSKLIEAMSKKDTQMEAMQQQITKLTEQLTKLTTALTSQQQIAPKAPEVAKPIQVEQKVEQKPVVQTQPKVEQKLVQIAEQKVDQKPAVQVVEQKEAKNPEQMNHQKLKNDYSSKPQQKTQINQEKPLVTKQHEAGK